MQEQSVIDLVYFAKLANAVAQQYNDGDRGTCILTTFAVIHVLRDFGLDARPLRVTCGIFPNDRKHAGAILGALDGCMEKRSSGKWRGHLAVIVDNAWLVDATSDQCNFRWGDEVGLDPVVEEVRMRRGAGDTLVGGHRVYD